MKLLKVFEDRYFLLLIFIVSVIFLTKYYIEAKGKEKAFKKSNVFVKGLIASCQYRKSQQKVIIYDYVVDEKYYRSKKWLTTDEKCSCGRIMDSLYHKYLPVLVSKSDYSVSELMLFEEDFREFNYSYPDSLGQKLNIPAVFLLKSK